MRIIVFTFSILLLIGCQKDPFQTKRDKRKVTGTVYEDCSGNVAKFQKIYLYEFFSGCFSGGIVSVDSTITDENGQFTFRYKGHLSRGNSTTSLWHSLTIPGSTINLYNPEGNYNIYPNDTRMNAVIRLHFPKPYKQSDTFYYQFVPTSSGVVWYPEAIGYLVGPFRDTMVTLENVQVGNVNNIDKGINYSGFFKWGIGYRNLNAYYTGKDGHFDLTHEPCAAADTFEYIVVPD